MGDSLEVLRRQIGATGELKTVVRAMKAISATSLSQYEKSVISLRDYYHTVQLGLRACLGRASEEGRVARPGTKSAMGVVIFGSDQGLVGQFNEAIAEYAQSVVPASAKATIWAVGERLSQSLEERGFTVAQHFGLPNSIEAITSLVTGLLEAFVRLEQSQGPAGLRIFHHAPMPGAGCEPMDERVLPIDDEWMGDLKKLKWPTPQRPETIGDPAAAIDALLREYLFVSLFRACAESLASENASRLMAMQRAEKNIDDLSAGLTKRFHRLRQSSIDEELFDVVAGFESLNGGGRAG